MSESIVCKGKIFEIIQKEVKEGEKTRIYEIARRSPGVRLIIIKDQKILLSREFRHELNSYDYRLPGGKVFDSLEEYKRADEKNILKHAEQAAVRECKEETGLVPKNIEYFQTAKAGATIEWDLYYFLIDRFSKGRQKLGEGEKIETEWKSFNEIKDMCIKGEIKEDRSIGILLRYLLSLHVIK